MNITTIAFILIGLTLVGWGLIGHGSVVVRALAIGVGVVIFLLGLALDVDQREWR